MCARIRECARGNACSRKCAGFAGSRIRVFVPLSRFHDVSRVCVARCACSGIHEFANPKKKIKKSSRTPRTFVNCLRINIHEHSYHCSRTSVPEYTMIWCILSRVFTKRCTHSRRTRNTTLITTATEDFANTFRGSVKVRHPLINREPSPFVELHGRNAMAVSIHRVLCSPFTGFVNGSRSRAVRVYAHKKTSHHNANIRVGT